MRIKELSVELQELVMQRHMEQYGDSDCAETVSGAFTWLHTPEGQDFWGNVDRGIDVRQSKYYPTIKSVNSYQIY